MPRSGQGRGVIVAVTGGTPRLRVSFPTPRVGRYPMRDYDSVSIAALPSPGTILFEGPVTPSIYELGGAHKVAALKGGFSAEGLGHIMLGGMEGARTASAPSDFLGNLFQPGTKTSVKASVNFLGSTPFDANFESWAAGIVFGDVGDANNLDNFGQANEFSRPYDSMLVAAGGGTGPLDDSSGNGRGLRTATGAYGPASWDAVSPEPRFDIGWLVSDGFGGLFLSNGVATPLTGNIDVAFAMVWEFGAIGTQSNILTVGDMFLRLNADGTLTYHHGTFTATSVLTVAAGMRGIVVRRTAGTRRLQLIVDGVTFIDTNWAAPGDQAVQAGATLIMKNDRPDLFDAALFEARVWLTAIPSDADLIAVADATDNTFAGVAEGTEWALWYMANPVSNVLQTLNLGAAGSRAYTPTAYSLGAVVAGVEVIVEVPLAAVLWSDCFVTLRVVDDTGAVQTLFDAVAPASVRAVGERVFGVVLLANVPQDGQNVQVRIEAVA